jgi:uncharacterized protein (DUF1697 family)
MTGDPDRTWVALLRGINVGGHTVTMARLRELFGELGLGRVRSHIQSGNLFFESDETDRAALRGRIEAHLQAALGYAVPACLRTVSELEELLARDPFAGVEVSPETRLAAVFCAEPIAQPVPVPFVTADGGYELIGATAAELFVVWRLKNGRPSQSFSAIEKLVVGPTTTRFWHTVAKILAAAKQI